MKFLRISQKVWISLGILVAGYFISMAIGFHLGQETETRLQDASSHLFPASMMSVAAVTAFDEQIKLYNDAVLMGESEIFTKTREKADKVSENLEHIAKMPTIDPDRRDDIAQTRKDHEAFTGLAQKIYAAMSAGEGDFDEKMIATLAQQTQVIRQKLETYKTGMSDNLKAELVDLSDQSKVQRMVNVGLFAVVVVVALLFASFIITRSISRPLNNTVKMLRDIAEGEGDLTKRLETGSKDEVGEMAKWFNIFIDKLQAIVTDIAGNAATLESSSETLTGLSAKVSKGASSMSEKSNSVSLSAEEVNNNMSSVAVAAEQASTNVSMVATAAEEMTATSNEIAQHTEKTRLISDSTVSRSKDALEKINALGAAARQIGQVTETIAEISDQTNLLALNATIEAARAGEAGKGFAVVANEIKELAKQTAEATLEVKTKIETIQDSTEDTVKEIEVISTVIKEMNEMVSTVATAIEEQSAATNEIGTNVSQASQGIQEMAENVNQSAVVISEIANDITAVNQAAGEMDNSSSQVNMSAEDLSQLSEKLNTIVSQFKI